LKAAKALRLNPRWIQEPGTAKEHFDLTSGKRQQAIKWQSAAIELDLNEISKIARRRTLDLEGKPSRTN